MKKIIKSLLLITASLCMTSCYTWWEEKIGLDTTTDRASLAEFFYKKPVIKSLESPAQVIASQGYYSGAIKLRWSEVENATSYRIERAAMPKNSKDLPDEGDFSVINEYVYGTTYTDIILSNPSYTSDAYSNIYYYRISAENISRGLESSEYTDITQESTKAAGWLLTPPEGVDASKGGSPTEIKVVWNKVPGANQYKIYRGESPEDFRMVEIATVRGTENQYVNSIKADEKGIEFYYQIAAIHSTGNVSAKSSYALGYALANASLLPPENLTVTNPLAESKSELQLTWTPKQTKDDSLTFSIYRSSNKDTSYRLVKQNIDCTTGSYTDKENLKPGVIYYYYIQAVKAVSADKKEKSAFSQKGPFGFLLSAPTTVEAGDYINTEGTVSDQFINIRWKDALGAEGTEDDYGLKFKYNIYYSDDLNGQFTELKNPSPLELTADEEGYYEYRVEKKGFFKISTINSSNKESNLSSTIAPVPDAPRAVYASKTEGGSLIQDYVFESTGNNYNNNEVYPVRITWQPPASNPAPTGYNIYRSTKPDSSFRKLNEEPVTECTFIDMNETARAGTYYYYKVVSLNVLGLGNKSNDPVNDAANSCRGYGALTRSQWFREYNKTVMRSQSKLTLMHKPVDTDKLGRESINGDISGSLSYNAAISGLGAKITMHYEQYADFWAGDDQSNGPYFKLTGNTDTKAEMSGDGDMSESVTVTGMYPGIADYNSIKIKGGAAGGGGYKVTTMNLNNETILSAELISWLIGEEGR